MFRKNILYVYTDGSSFAKPRRGGIGIRYVYLNDREEECRIDIEEFGTESGTNNQMELKAVIYSLKKISQQKIPIKYNSIEIRTDSRYITDNFNSAKYYWLKNKWFNKDGRPIENATLWKDLINQIGKVHSKVEIVWVKGHRKDSDNKAVDKMAKKSASSILGPPIIPVKIRRKKTSQTTKIGSIEMKGQCIKIHIITESFMRLQKLSKYRYEVLSRGSKFYNCVDIIFSELHQLKAGHSYKVTFNKNTRNPRILKVIEELN